jgi:hypothetical protein
MPLSICAKHRQFSNSQLWQRGRYAAHLKDEARHGPLVVDLGVVTRSRHRAAEIETKRKRDKVKERKLLVAPREFQQLKPGGRWQGVRTSSVGDGMKRVLTSVPGQRPHIWVAKENLWTRVLCPLRPGYGHWYRSPRAGRN